MPKQVLFANRPEAEAERRRWKEALPVVPTAYQPSGKMPENALKVMSLGVIAGIPAGAALGAVVGGVGALLSVGAVSLVASMHGGRGTFFIGLVALALVLGTFFGMYIVVGSVASRTVFLVGKRVKNRNVKVAAVLSVTAALGALVPFQIIMSYSPQLVDGGGAEALAAVFGTGTFGLCCLAAGGVIAALAASGRASRSVKMAKFCEICEKYMDSRKSRPVSLESVKQAVASLNASDTAAAATALSPVQAKEQEGSLELFTCPQCRSGYAEMKVMFAAKWPKNKKNQFDTLNETWQVFSKAMPPGETDRLEKGATLSAGA
jgi:hypothetical protein